MALSVCTGCRRHIREDEDCPFCGARPRTTLHVWKAAILTAMMPLGLTACYGAPQTPDSVEGKPPPTAQDAKAPEVDSATPDPSGHDPAAPDKPKPSPTPSDSSAEPDSQPKPEPGTEPPAPADSGSDNTKPEGTDDPIVERPRPAKKYGAPPRPATKYGGPPRPKPPKPKP